MVRCSIHLGHLPYTPEEKQRTLQNKHKRYRGLAFMKIKKKSALQNEFEPGIRRKKVHSTAREWKYCEREHNI